MMVPVPVVTVDAAEAISGSVIAAVPNNTFKAIEMFIICFLC